MNSNIISIEIKTVEEAPNYNTGENDGGGFKPLHCKKAIIVKNGTVEGNCTVDLQFVDDQGQKHVYFVTGKIIQALAAAISAHQVD